MKTESKEKQKILKGKEVKERKAGIVGSNEFMGNLLKFFENCKKSSLLTTGSTRFREVSLKNIT